MRLVHRRQTIDVTAHERLMLAFYRSAPRAQRQDIDGLLFSWWTLPRVHRRFTRESQALRVCTPTAAQIRPFADASVEVLGIQRRLP